MVHAATSSGSPHSGAAAEKWSRHKIYVCPGAILQTAALYNTFLFLLVLKLVRRSLNKSGSPFFGKNGSKLTHPKS